MRASRRWTLLLVMVAAAPAAAGSVPPSIDLPQSALGEETRIIHALNRLGYGPRPGEIERVRVVGLAAWICEQLHPERIADPQLERRLAPLGTLRMSLPELLVAYPPPPLVRTLGRRLRERTGMSEDRILELFPEMERFGDAPASRGQAGERGRIRRLLEGPGRIGMELGMAKLIRAVHGRRQLEEVMTDFWFNHFNVHIGKGAGRWMVTGYERDAIRPQAMGRFRDLLGAVAHHPAMLFYLDNWLSGDPSSDVTRRDLRLWAAEAIEEQGMPPGGVATLLLRERGMETRGIETGIARREANLRRGRSRGAGMSEPVGRGLNENYARELLELHTLGVDAGYTQDDVLDVARSFAGWTLLPLDAGQGFHFARELESKGRKTVLGEPIRGRGEAQGEAVLDLLASHPATARSISIKLARRFVADEPPEALVEAMAEAFLETDGEIRAVLRVMFESRGFWSPEVVFTKVKTPLEFVASAMRATGAELRPLPNDSERRKMPGLLHGLKQLGQPLYACEPPTGYDDVAASWVSTGSMLGRMKLSLGLAIDRIPGVRVPPPPGWKGEGTTEEEIVERSRGLLGFEVASSTVEAISGQLDRGPAELADLGVMPALAGSAAGRGRLVLGWLLASPDFQKR